MDFWVRAVLTAVAALVGAPGAHHDPVLHAQEAVACADRLMEAWMDRWNDE